MAVMEEPNSDTDEPRCASIDPVRAGCRRSRAAFCSSTSRRCAPSSCAEARASAFERPGAAAAQARARRDGRGPARAGVLRRAGRPKPPRRRTEHEPSDAVQIARRARLQGLACEHRRSCSCSSSASACFRVHQDEEDRRRHALGRQEPRRAPSATSRCSTYAAEPPRAVRPISSDAPEPRSRRRRRVELRRSRDLGIVASRRRMPLPICVAAARACPERDSESRVIYATLSGCQRSPRLMIRCSSDS